MPDWFRLARLGALLSLPPLLGAAYAGAADDPVVARILTRLAEYYAGENPEKVYLHFDKPYYATGETVWFRAYVVEAGQHRPDTLSRVLYADLLAPNGRVLTQRTLRLRRAGAAAEFALGDSLAAGVYTVRAYTSWMRNAAPELLFTRRLPVYRLAVGSSARPAEPVAAGKSRLVTAAPAAARPDVQFFPEGGNLVAGLDNTVAFKATDAAGLGLAVSGTVLNAQNQEVVAFEARHRGMGHFPLRPEPGQTYRARVKLPGGGTAEFPLPAAQATGYTLAVRTIADNLMLVVQRRDQPTGPAAAPVTVVAHVRGQVAFVGQAQVANGAAFSARIPRNRFPAGVAHFTLFDGAGVPQAERLVFVPPTGTPRLTLTPDKASYGPKERVQVSVEVRDAAGQPVAADLSVAATQTPEVPGTAAFGENILTNLLLTSDLRGFVEDPAWYFRDGQPEALLAVDYLMLTQGWRRFVWRELLEQQPAAARLYPLEQGLSIGGQVLRPAGRKPADQVQVTLFTKRPKQEILQGTTNADGRFLFTGFQWADTAQVLIQARQGKNSNLLIRLLPPWPEAVARPPFALPGGPDAAAPLQAYAERSRRQQQTERQFRLDTTQNILLGNVTVQGRRVPEEARDGRFRLYSSANAAVVRAADVVGGASFSSPLQLLQGRVPGVQISGTGMDMEAQIRGGTSISGSNAPLYLLDGVPVDAAAINSIPVADVESIEVLKGAGAAIYGSQGANGAIAVYTKRGNPSYDYSKEPAPGSVALRRPGYYRAREFYAPRYDNAKQPARPDPRRTTLYWNPTVRTDANGRAQLTFFTSEEAGPFRLLAEGLTATGQPGLGSAELKVTAGR
ncbi:hypothetical protein GCM10027048_17060 [Hymenobacter coalescens]